MSKRFCINCDGKVNYCVNEIAGEYLVAVCDKCGEAIYVPEVNDYNATLSNLRREKARLVTTKFEKARREVCVHPDWHYCKDCEYSYEPESWDGGCRLTFEKLERDRKDE